MWEVIGALAGVGSLILTVFLEREKIRDGLGNSQVVYLLSIVKTGFAIFIGIVIPAFLVFTLLQIFFPSVAFDLVFFVFPLLGILWGVFDLRRRSWKFLLQLVFWSVFMFFAVIFLSL